MPASERKAVLITGGTGFLGGHLVREFSDAGYRVGILCRESSDRSGLSDFDVKFFVANIADRDSTDQAIGAAVEALGPCAMVHNAALISYRSKDAERLFEANVTGVRHVFEACQKHGIKDVVHVSSVVGVGPSPGGKPCDETAAYTGAALNVPYMNTKRAGEVLALGDWPGLRVRVVNPGAIFGPVGADSNSARFLIGVGQGKIGRLAPPGGMAVVGVWDCARGVLLALEQGKPGQRYILCESYVNNRQLFALVGKRLLGKDPVWWRLPKWFWSAFILAVRGVSLMREPLMTTPHALKMLGVEFHHVGDKARKELGWSPEPFGSVLDRTIAEMTASGILPG